MIDPSVLEGLQLLAFALCLQCAFYLGVIARDRGR